MTDILPTPLNKVNIDGFKLKFTPLLKLSHYKVLFGRTRAALITKQVGILVLSLIITSIIYTLVYNTNVYYTYVRNMDPAILRIGRLNIKTRKVANHAVNIMILITLFVVLNILI